VLSSNHWQDRFRSSCYSPSKLLIQAAENGDPAAATKQLTLALLLDGDITI
jgi:hypothetical protein